jgi:putrescine transport system ATP-binding protein
LQRKLGLTFVIVTHDQEEAMALANRIGVMNAGQLAQVAAPSVIYEQPNSRWVASFIGDINLFDGKVMSSSLGQTSVELRTGERVFVSHPVTTNYAGTLSLAVRPEKVRVDTAANSAKTENCFPGRVVEVGYLGGASVLRVKLDSNALEMKATVTNSERGTPALGAGDRVWLSFQPAACVVLEQ